MVWETKTNQLLLGVKSDILDYVIDKVEDTLETLQDYAIYQYKKKFGDIDNYEIDWIKLHIKRDLIETFEKQTKPTDNLVNLYIDGNVNNIITFKCVIKRDDINHELSSHIIWNGLKSDYYFRYLTKTTLAPTDRKDMSIRYNDEIKKLIDRKSLENKIYFTELNMNRIKCNILLSESKSAEDIISSQKQDWSNMHELNWKQVCELGLDVLYDDEEEFIFVKQSSIQYALEKYKDIRINRPLRKVEDLTVELQSLKRKLKTLH